MFCPNSPPVPEKLVTRIQSGEYIDMASLLPEALSQAMASDDNKADKKKARKIESINAWVECFSVFMGVLIAKHPERAHDLLGYLHLIVHVSRQFQGMQWQVYDTKFTQIAAAKKSGQWAHVDSSLWTLAFAHAQPANHCATCLGLDHTSEECPDKVESPAKRRKLSPTRSGERGESTKQICKRFNFGSCSSPFCSFRHVCLECHGQHRKPNCHLRRTGLYEAHRHKVTKREGGWQSSFRNGKSK